MPAFLTHKRSGRERKHGPAVQCVHGRCLRSVSFVSARGRTFQCPAHLGFLQLGIAGALNGCRNDRRTGRRLQTRHTAWASEIQQALLAGHQRGRQEHNTSREVSSMHAASAAQTALRNE